VSRPGVLVTPEAAAFLRARAAWMRDPYDKAINAADYAALSAWHNIGLRVDPDEAPAGPLLAHGYRPEHGDPVVWAAELLDTVTNGADASNEEVFRLMDVEEDLRRQLTAARNDIATLKAANDTLVSLVTQFRDEAFRPQRGLLSRIFR
jgi:hypothetical protein